jgi:hypothetical protein
MQQCNFYVKNKTHEQVVMKNKNKSQQHAHEASTG